tara:strand:- start:6676 stop:8283 length:1608 start_codon:yes stop_codon:yes gene_type:complete
MSLLIVYQGHENIKDHADYSYSLDIGQVKNTVSLNNANKLNDIALKLRDEYCDFIFSINKDYLKNNLIYKNKLSLYFISDLSNKRTELFETFSIVCHIDLLNDYIKKKDITKVKFINCNDNFINSFKSKINLQIVESKSKNYKVNKIYFLRQVFFFTKFLFVAIFIKIIFKNLRPKKIKNIFLSRFPLHFDKFFNEDKYGLLVQRSDYFLISILTDGMHQKLSIIKCIKEIIKLKKISKKKNILFLDKEVSIKDIIRNFFYSIYVYYRFRGLYKKTYFFKGVDISKYIFEEIDSSLLRIPRLTLYKNALKKICRNKDINNFYYHLHEYSYGKFVSFVLSQYYPNINRIGFQHGPASMRKLIYFLSKDEVDYTSKDRRYFLPMPNIILAEDQYSATVYNSGNYKNVHIMDDIPRLAYLKNIKRINIQKNSVLVACGLHDSSYIFNYLKNEIRNNSHKKYYFKLHPRSNNRLILKVIMESGLSNIEISKNNIVKYLSMVEEVIFTYSSVGQEAFKLGIKTRIILLPGRINESPEFDI